MAEQSQQDSTGRIGDSEISKHIPDQVPLTQMSARQQHGLEGFLAAINSRDPLVSGLAKGIELDTLGLNLGSAEYASPTHYHTDRIADRRSQTAV